MPFTINPIKFGTDGWRGVIAADFTFDRVAKVAPVAAQVLSENYGNSVKNDRLVIVGYDRRFMADEFAKIAAEAIREAGFDVLLSNTYAPTPAFSWAAFSEDALGAIVITASHNPAYYLGLKVKGAFGGSVAREITKQIEGKLSPAAPESKSSGSIEKFDPWPSYCTELRSKVNIDAIKIAIAQREINIYADVMHGSAATGLQRLLDCEIKELNGDRDPLFGGGAPEPLPHNLSDLFLTIKTAAQIGTGLRVGLVFDGDGDRIAAIDGLGNFLSSQILIPILIEHLGKNRGFKGEVVKTVSGSDLIPKVAQYFDCPVCETPIGYKYITERMLNNQVLIGGEESGGIGYGNHIPERDALLSALYVIEAIVASKKDLSKLYSQLQELTNFTSAYNRIDRPLASMKVKERLRDRLENDQPTKIAGLEVVDCLAVDGYKFRLSDNSWLLIRFSGTEPLLRLYCEAATNDRVTKTLKWAKHWASTV